MKFLVVVDAQNDFISGELGSEYARAVVPRIVDKINQFEGVILTTHDTHYANYMETQEGKNLPVEHCQYLTWGWFVNDQIQDAIQKRVKTGCASIPFTKYTFGSWDLATYLRDYDHVASQRIEEIILVGYDTDICVLSNAIIAKTAVPDVRITVDASCCCGSSAERHRAALEVMKSCQIDVINECEDVPNE